MQSLVLILSLVTFSVQAKSIPLNVTAEATPPPINMSVVEFETQVTTAASMPKAEELTTLAPMQPVEEPMVIKKTVHDLCSDPSGSCSRARKMSWAVPIGNVTIEQLEANITKQFYLDECQFCPEKRFLQHYFDKKCQPMEVREQCAPKFCPKYFRCPKEEELPVDGCKFNSTVYKFGEDVPQGNPCRFCVCINSTVGPTLNCATVDCFEVGGKLEPNCYLKYSDDKCCPEKVCLEPSQPLSTCSFEGQTHTMGDNFAPNEDPCYSCTCDERWNQTFADRWPTMAEKGNETSRGDYLGGLCRKITCENDADRAEHRGCVPVYSDHSCCPNYYHCPKEKTHQVEDEPRCQFGNETYELGEKVKVKQHEICLECHCLVPPEITCKHRSCPTLPDNCTRVYTEGECCAVADCTPPKSVVDDEVPKVITPTTVAPEEMFKECPPIDSCHEPCRILVDVSNNTTGGGAKCPQCQCDTAEQTASVEITLANVTMVEEDENKKDKKEKLQQPETATVLTMLEPKKVEIKRESKQAEIATKNIEEKVEAEEVIATTSTTIIESSMPAAQQANTPTTEAPASLAPKPTTSSSTPASTSTTSTPASLGERCPAVACNFPCIIFRDPASGCPACSCSSPAQERKNIHLASKLTFN